jgi:hypothetical protein
MVEDSGTNLLNQKPHLISSKNALNGATPKKDVDFEEDGTPPDGGARAWLVMVGSFFCNGILFGVINSYSVLYTEFHKILEDKGSTNPSGEAGENRNRLQRSFIFRPGFVLYVFKLRNQLRSCGLKWCSMCTCSPALCCQLVFRGVAGLFVRLGEFYRLTERSCRDLFRLFTHEKQIKKISIFI